jgi:hypothetical protein
VGLGAADDEDDNPVGEIADGVIEAPSQREPDALHDAHAPTHRQPLHE